MIKIALAISALCFCQLAISQQADDSEIEEIIVIGELSRSARSEEHTSELQSRTNLVCRLLLEKKKKIK